MIFLQGQGISATFAVKIFKTYGAVAMAINNRVERRNSRLKERLRG
ncbi:MAG: hypothetical protein KKC20_10440 [Proteobacteria bacterium]|nr:hypothetical protein [Pseudomonadota bacterium]